MNPTVLHELGLGLRAGDREAAFRLQQRQRGKMSAEVMKARGWPNLIVARAKRARLKGATPAVEHVEAPSDPASRAGARLSPSPPAVEPRHFICVWCGFGQNSVPMSPCIACKRPLY